MVSTAYKVTFKILSTQDYLPFGFKTLYQFFLLKSSLSDDLSWNNSVFQIPLILTQFSTFYHNVPTSSHYSSHLCFSKCNSSLSLSRPYQSALISPSLVSTVFGLHLLYNKLCVFITGLACTGEVEVPDASSKCLAQCLSRNCGTHTYDELKWRTSGPEGGPHCWIWKCTLDW